MKGHAPYKIVLGLAFVVDPEIARCDADNRSLAVSEDFSGWEARINFDAKRLRLLGQPAHDITETDDVSAMVRHQWRHQKVWDAHLAFCAEIKEPVFRYFLGDGSPLLLPIRDQGVEANRVDHGS